MPTADLHLLPLRAEDEITARRAHQALEADRFTFLLDLRGGEPWSEYLRRLDDQVHGRDLPADRVPATFLAAWVGDELVGRVSVRHRLNDYLATHAGHIGYGVVPGHRRRGYATEIVRQALVVARSVGVDDVLVACAETNTGSARTIEACGGVLEAVVLPPGENEPLRRYWIMLQGGAVGTA